MTKLMVVIVLAEKFVTSFDNGSHIILISPMLTFVMC